MRRSLTCPTMLLQCLLSFSATGGYHDLINVVPRYAGSYTMPCPMLIAMQRNRRNAPVLLLPR